MVGEHDEIGSKASVFDREIDKGVDTETSEEIGEKIKRRIEGRKGNRGDPMQGLSLMGMVGWSVAIPTVLGLLFGVWIDKKIEGEFSLTLSFMFFGMFVGLYNASYWVRKESGVDVSSSWFKEVWQSKARKKKAEQSHKGEDKE